MRKDNQEIKTKVKNLNGWSLNGNSIEKTFKFDNFLESVNFVNKIASLAERVNHHPDITINYNKVKITLSTHDEGGVTDKDITLAAKIDSMI